MFKVTKLLVLTLMKHTVKLVVFKLKRNIVLPSVESEFSGVTSQRK